jgi:putative endonuclease
MITVRLSTIALCPQARSAARPECRTVSPMTTARQAVGAYGERVAEQHLTAQGLVVIARNWRCPEGEIDLILRDGDDVVFCEVKTRRGTLYGTPAEAVVGAKARRLRRLAARWLAATRVRPREVRFDVVAVLPQPRGAARVEHLRGAF